MLLFGNQTSSLAIALDPSSNSVSYLGKLYTLNLIDLVGRRGSEAIENE
jgi:hypothetical protein